MVGPQPGDTGARPGAPSAGRAKSWSGQWPGRTRPPCTLAARGVLSGTRRGDWAERGSPCTCLGPRDLPTGVLWLRLLAAPRPGGAPFLGWSSPGLGAQPLSGRGVASSVRVRILRKRPAQPHLDPISASPRATPRRVKAGWARSKQEEGAAGRGLGQARSPSGRAPAGGRCLLAWRLSQLSTFRQSSPAARGGPQGAPGTGSESPLLLGASGSASQEPPCPG